MPIKKEDEGAVGCAAIIAATLASAAIGGIYGWPAGCLSLAAFFCLAIITKILE
jgi:hypothetical protein